MKIFSQLVSAQVENKASDYSAGTTGRIWINTSSGLIKYDDASNIKTLVTTDNTQTLTNKTFTLGSSANKAAYFDGSNNLAAESTLAVSRGGTNIGSYTTGDILYASGAAALSKLSIGSDGTFLGVSGGALTYTSPSGLLSKTTKTTTYTIQSTDDVIYGDTSGAAFTLTLPAATGSGKVFRIKYIDTGFTNALTVARDGSDTIRDTVASLTSTTLNTAGEEIEIQDSASGVWDILNRRIPSIWISYTPTWTGLGTMAASTGFWRRVGDSIQLQVFAEAGTAAGTTVSASLPGSLSIDTAKGFASNRWAFGVATVSTGGGGSGVYVVNTGVAVVYDSADATKIYFVATNATDASGNVYGAPATTILNTGGQINLQALIPISGWKG